MDIIVIPGWVLSNVGGFVGLVILSGVLFRAQTHYQERKEQKTRDKEQKTRDKEQKTRDKEQEARNKEQAIKRKKDQERRELLDRLLPGPWRTFYEFLHGCPKMTRQAVLLTAVSFERDIGNIPDICPAGFDLILEVSYYNLEGEGNCHKEFTELLKDHVKFPKDYGN